ncbi:MAG: serine hydrolase domain-containing protein, partial [Pseudomonadota bacterium]
GDLASRVEAYLEGYRITGNFSGQILIARDGEILLSRAYGHADPDALQLNNNETVFHLASVSRIFTSAAILLLVQEGRLGLQDPLSKHLPDWPRGDEITIHHLLTLSAGFPNINSMARYPLWSQFSQTPESLVKKFRDLPLEFTPGKRSVHSNSNYNVLALLIERLARRSYGQFLEEALFEPLGMQRTSHDGNGKQTVANEAIGFAPVGLGGLEPAPTLDWSVKTGNGSIYSTAEDLYRFDRMLVAGSLLTDASVRQTFTEHFENSGYGWFIVDRAGRTEVHINGRSPGFGTYWGRSVDEDVTVIVLGNIYNSVSTPIGRDLISMVLEEPIETPILSREPIDPKLAKSLVGTYRMGPDFYVPNAEVQVTTKDGHLFSRSAWLMPAGGSTFVHRIYWSTLDFRQDGSGRFVDLKYDDFVGKRLD